MGSLRLSAVDVNLPDDDALENRPLFQMATGSYQCHRHNVQGHTEILNFRLNIGVSLDIDIWSQFVGICSSRKMRIPWSYISFWSLLQIHN
jgi:hypothetical protein